MNNITFPQVHRNMMSLMIPHSTDYVILVGDTCSNKVGILENTYMNEAQIDNIGASFIKDPQELTDNHRFTMGIFLVNPLDAYGDDRDAILEKLLASNSHRMQKGSPTDQLRLFRHWQKHNLTCKGYTDIRFDQYPFTLFFGGHRVEHFAAHDNTTIFGTITDLGVVEDASVIRTALALLQRPSVVVLTADASGNSDTLTIQVFSGTKDIDTDTQCANMCMHYIVSMAVDVLHGVKYATKIKQATPLTGILAPPHLNTLIEYRPEIEKYGIIGWTHPKERCMYSRRRINGFLDAINTRMKGATDAQEEDRGKLFGDNFEPYKRVESCDPLVFLLRKAEERNCFAWRSW